MNHTTIIPEDDKSYSHYNIMVSKWNKIGIFWILNFLLKFSGDLKFLFSDLSAPMVLTGIIIYPADIFENNLSCVQNSI